VDLVDEVLARGELAAAEQAAGQDREEDLDLVEPGGVLGRVMDDEPGTRGQPGPGGFGGVRGTVVPSGELSPQGRRTGPSRRSGRSGSRRSLSVPRSPWPRSPGAPRVRSGADDPAAGGCPTRPVLRGESVCASAARWRCAAGDAGHGGVTEAAGGIQGDLSPLNVPLRGGAGVRQLLQHLPLGAVLHHRERTVHRHASPLTSMSAVISVMHGRAWTSHASSLGPRAR